MPTYKVGYRYIVVEAPDEKAAPASYETYCEAWSPEGFSPEANLCEEIPDYAVDAEGYAIEEEDNVEARAFRLASRGQVSEEVFSQEIGLIRTRQRWLAEQRERLEQQLGDIRRYSFNPQSVKMLCQRLEARLATATPEDRRFILKALSVKVMAQADRTWELELQVPREAPVPAAGLQIASSRPGASVHNLQPMLVVRLTGR